MTRQIELQLKNYDTVAHWTVVADTKAGFAMTVALGILGFVLSADKTAMSLWTAAAVVTAAVGALVSLVVFFPRLGKAPLGATARNIWFFRHIGSFPAERDFASAWAHAVADDQRFLDEITNQVHINSRIATRKFIGVRVAMGFIAASVVLLVISIWIGVPCNLS